MNNNAHDFGNPDVFYALFYESMPCGDSGFMASVPHKQLERGFHQGDFFHTTLEVGGGSGNHVPFVRHNFRRYILSDLRQDSLQRAKDLVSSDARFETRVSDAQALSIPTESIDRLVATCLLIHLEDPEKALMEWKRVTRPGGVLSIYVPMEGPALRMLRRLTTEPKAKKLGFAGYRLYLARDHINRSEALDELIKFIFNDSSITAHAWPLPRAPYVLRLFTVYTIVKAVN